MQQFKQRSWLTQVWTDTITDTVLGAFLKSWLYTCNITQNFTPRYLAKRNNSQCPQNDLTWMFTTSSFTTAKNGKQCKYRVRQKVLSAYRKTWMKCLAKPISANRWMSKWGFPCGIVVKNPPANTGDERDMGLISRSEDSLEEVKATHSSVLAWRIPQIEEPGRLQSMGSQRVRND